MTESKVKILNLSDSTKQIKGILEKCRPFIYDYIKNKFRDTQNITGNKQIIDNFADWTYKKIAYDVFYKTKIKSYILKKTISHVN
jgi:hypothetical protein